MADYGEHREIVIQEIASWKVEAEEMEISNEDLSDYVDHLKTLDPKDLQAWWTSTVGEWVASRHDVDMYPEDCFELILEGEERPYGFLQWVEVSL